LALSPCPERVAVFVCYVGHIFCGLSAARFGLTPCTPKASE
jgi:hypothetical protein